MNTNRSEFIKIVLALSAALIVTYISTSALFFLGSPRLNPIFLAKLAGLFQKKNPFDELKNIPIATMKKLSTGIYAKEEPNIHTTFFRITGDAQFQVQELIINEKNLRVLVPKQ